MNVAKSLYDIKTKQDWELANGFLRVVNTEVKRERCINCLFQESGRCEKFSADIPENHLYPPTECMYHEPDIPF